MPANVNGTHRFCIDCRKLRLMKRFHHDHETTCIRCQNKRANVARKRDIAVAARTFSRKVRQMKDPAEMRAVMAEFAESVGEGDQGAGDEVLGRMLAEDFQEARKNKAKQPRVLLDYYRMVFTAISEENRQRSEAGEMDGAAEDEMRDNLVPLCAEWLLRDEVFRAAVMELVLGQNPDFIAELMEESGHPVLEHTQ